MDKNYRKNKTKQIKTGKPKTEQSRQKKIKTKKMKMNLKNVFVALTLSFTICVVGCKKDEEKPTSASPSATPLFKGCSLQGTITSIGTLYPSCGNQTVDLAMSQELQFLSSFCLAYPSFFYYDDSQGANAFANSTIMNSPDGTVCFGFRMFNQQAAISNGGTNVPIVLAHEFAHIVAMKYDINLPTKENELFADYLAGCYMFYRNKYFKPTDIQAAYQAFYNLGDNYFTAPDHHGTPQSRLTCIQEGFNQCNAANQQGINYPLSNLINMAYSFVTTHNLPRTMQPLNNPAINSK